MAAKVVGFVGGAGACAAAALTARYRPAVGQFVYDGALSTGGAATFETGSLSNGNPGLESTKAPARGSAN